VIGGADMIAFLHAGDIFTVNVDGSELKQLTQDGGNKTGINWSPDGENILYINGLCVYSININTLAITKILCSNWATYLSNFEISPDGNYVAMTSSDGLYILPYDLLFLSQIRWPDQLKGDRTCQFYSEGKIRSVRWSDTSDRVAIITTGSNSGLQVELVRVLQVLPCGSTPERLAEFPSNINDIRNYSQNPIIQSFGWDGEFIFYLNTNFLNDFGEIYRYNFLQTTSGERLSPFGNLCCFRDFTWTPDNEYVMFAFQDNRFAKITQLYIVPVNTIGSGSTYIPLNLPENILSSPKEKPQAVFRPQP
jgi:WD40 repeat protein